MYRIILLCFLSGASHAVAAEPEFIRICNNGDTAGQGVCPAKPQPGERPHDWGCSKQRQTGLLWSIQSLHGTWAAATQSLPQTLDAAAHCGLARGWRAPTRAELLSLQARAQQGWLSALRQAKRPDAAIANAYFPATRSDWYWSADTLDADPAYAWFVYFAHGYSNQGNAYSGYKTAPHYVHLVNDNR